MALDPKLLELLVCPVTKGPLTMSADKDELISRSARLAYPVRDGIAIMLETQARVLSDEEIEALHAHHVHHVHHAHHAHHAHIPTSP